MKAMIATLVLVLASPLWASSFDDFANTGGSQVDVRDIIIKFKGDASARSLGFARGAMVQSPIIKDMNLHLLQLNPTMDVEKVLQQLRQHPDVVYAQLDHKVTSRVAAEEPEADMLGPVKPAETNPNDTYYGSCVS